MTPLELDGIFGETLRQSIWDGVILSKMEEGDAFDVFNTLIGGSFELLYWIRYFLRYEIELIGGGQLA